MNDTEQLPAVEQDNKSGTQTALIAAADKAWEACMKYNYYCRADPLQAMDKKQYFRSEFDIDI